MPGGNWWDWLMRELGYMGGYNSLFPPAAPEYVGGGGVEPPPGTVFNAATGMYTQPTGSVAAPAAGGPGAGYKPPLWGYNTGFGSLGAGGGYALGKADGVPAATPGGYGAPMWGGKTPSWVQPNAVKPEVALSYGYDEDGNYVPYLVKGYNDDGSTYQYYTDAYYSQEAFAGWRYNRPNVSPATQTMWNQIFGNAPERRQEMWGQLKAARQANKGTRGGPEAGSAATPTGQGGHGMAAQAGAPAGWWEQPKLNNLSPERLASMSNQQKHQYVYRPPWMRHIMNMLPALTGGGGHSGGVGGGAPTAQWGGSSVIWKP